MTAQEALTKFAEWARLKGEYGLAADIDHSALLRRLLDGKAALPRRPPKAFSYPWYSLMETGRDDRCEVGFYHEDGHDCVIVNQSAEWNLIERRGPDEAIIMFDGVYYNARRTCPDTSWGWTLERESSEQPPARSLAVDPCDEIVEGSQRAAESPSDPDRGAALGRLPREPELASALVDGLRLQLEIERATVARLRHLAHQLIEDWRKNSQDKVSPYGRLLSPWAQDAFTECADELAAALTEPLT